MLTKNNSYHLLLYIFTVISFIISGLLIYKYWEINNSFFPEIELRATKILDNSIDQINQKFNNLEHIAQSLASQISSGAYNSEKELKAKLTNILKDNGQIFGLGIAYEPNAFSKDKRLFAPYFIRNNSSFAYKLIQDQYDYTQKDWYKKPINKGAQWVGPYFGEASNSYIAEYAVPFIVSSSIGDSKSPSGIVFINYNLNKVKEFVSDLSLGNIGYGFITNKDGVIISHPVQDYLKNQVTVFDIAKKSNSKNLLVSLKKALQNNTGYFTYKDTLAGQQSWIFYKKISSTGWTLFLSFSKEEFLEDNLNILYQYSIWIIFSVVIFLVLLVTILTQVYQGKKLWYWSVIASFILLLGIIVLWYLQIYHRRLDVDDIKVYDQSGVKEIISDNMSHNSSSNLENIIEVPTGLLIRHIAFENLKKVNIVGSLWQRYIADNKSESLGFYFPNAVDQEKTPILSSKDNNQFSSWDFNAKVYQDFDYTEFPFDFKHISLHIRPLELKNNIVLVPDFEAYLVTNPRSLPGINKGLNVYGWNLYKSYFSYDIDHKLSTTISKYLGEKNIPQLHFNIILKRSFLHSFIAHIIPLLLALIFLFFILRAISIGRIENSPSIGFILTPIGVIISLFFAVILAHISLRNSLEGQPLFYLEYFYIIAYLIMFAALLITFSIVTNMKVRFIDYKNTIIPQILYWPVVLGLGFIVTIFTFYS